jgi:hypothetical protein
MAGRAVADKSGDAGFVTAETAVALPVLGLVLVACMAGAGVVRRELQVQDAARIAARAAARGEPADVVRRLALQFGPAGASVRVWRDGELVRVEVVADPALPGPFGVWVPQMLLRASSAALDESAPTRFSP